MENQEKRKIKNILINPRYQMKYVLWMTLTGISLVIINISVFYYFIKENYTILVDLSPMEEAVKLQLYHELDQILFLMAGFSFLFVLAMAVVGVVVTSRTAGPMRHFVRVFLDVQKGLSDSRIYLRPKDDFVEVAAECNRMLDYLTQTKK